MPEIRYGKGGRDGYVRHILRAEDPENPALLAAVCGRRVDRLIDDNSMWTCQHCIKRSPGFENVNASWTDRRAITPTGLPS